MNNIIIKVKPQDIVVAEGFNSRTDFGDIEGLAKSLEVNGMLQPISVFPIEVNGEKKYRLINGERRYRATMYNLEKGITNTIYAIVEKSNIDTKEQLIEQIVTNDGKGFNEMERAIHYKKLLDMGMTREEIIERVDGGTKRIDYCLQHLNRDERVQKAILDGKIEGVLVRHIYSAHGKNDKEGAVNEILTSIGLAEERAKAEGKDDIAIHITKKDLISDNVRVSMDTKAIKKGLVLLLTYNDALNPNHYSLGKLRDIAKALGTNGTTIEDVIKEAIARANVKKAE